MRILQRLHHTREGLTCAATEGAPSQSAVYSERFNSSRNLKRILKEKTKQKNPNSRHYEKQEVKGDD